MENNYLFGMHPIFEALASNKDIDKVMIKKGLASDRVNSLIKILEEREIPFQFVPVEKLDKITKGKHQGVIATLNIKSYTPLSDAIESALEKSKAPLILLLDGVSDVRNFGAIARTSECAGVNCIIIPSKGGASITPDAIKTSAGALLRIDVCRVSNLKEAIYYLLDCNFNIVAATEKCNDYMYNIDFTKPTAIIMGAEDKGISNSLLALATDKAKIPMQGNIGSLNVSTAAAIVLYEALRQRIG